MFIRMGHLLKVLHIRYFHGQILLDPHHEYIVLLIAGSMKQEQDSSKRKHGKTILKKLNLTAQFDSKLLNGFRLWLQSTHGKEASAVRDSILPVNR